MTNKVVFANILRGVAAVAVLFTHYFGVFWARADAAAGLINAPQIAKSGGIYILTWLAKGHVYFSGGEFGVALFFLISGFVIPFSFEKQTRLGFIVSRFMRLWPTYAVGLTGALFFVWLSSAAFNRAFPFSLPTIAWNYGLGLRDLAWAPGVDGIVWTLEIEVRFYLLCLVIAPWLRAGRLSGILAAAVAVGVISAAANCLWPSILAAGGPWIGPIYMGSLDGQMILYMLIGTLFNFHMRGLVRLSWLLPLIAGDFLACGALWRHGPLTSSFLDGMGSYAIALALFTGCYVFRERIGGRGALNWLASRSYSLYVMHAVPGYVIMRLAMAHGFRPWVCVGMALAWAFGSATIVHRVIEAPTHRLGRKWARSLSRTGAIETREPAVLTAGD